VFGSVTNAFVHFFTRLVFSPVVWLGVIVFVVAFVLIGAGGFVSQRRQPAAKPSSEPRRRRAEQPKAVSRASQNDPLIDDELAEIQAILKKRGIS